MNQETLAIYAQDLSSYDIGAITEALELIGKESPQDFKQIWPAVGTIQEAIRGVIRLRGDRRSIDAENERVAHFKANPEMYETPAEVAEMAKKINERFGFERPKVIDTTPVMQACPHCSQELPVGPNIRFWTPEELRSYANVLESNQAIASANRAAMMEQQSVPAEGVV